MIWKQHSGADSYCSPAFPIHTYTHSSVHREGLYAGFSCMRARIKVLNSGMVFAGSM